MNSRYTISSSNIGRVRFHTQRQMYLNWIRFILAFAILGPRSLPAAVYEVKIIDRQIVNLTGSEYRYHEYEILKGVIHLKVDPKHAANADIVDLGLAPTDDMGLVSFETEFELHIPSNKYLGNRRLLYFVNNRGNKMGTWHFNYAKSYNWLYSQGYSILWCGWNPDVEDSDTKFNMTVPVAKAEDGTAISGRVYSEIISYYNEVISSLPTVWGGSKAYPPINMDKSDAILTVRRYRSEKPDTIPNTEWEFGNYIDSTFVPDPGRLFMRGGIQPGYLYDLTYTAKDPRIAGLGMAAIRDVVSFFRYDEMDQVGFSNPLFGRIDHAYAWGHSQSGRLLNHFVSQDFNLNEVGELVFDGVMANCPGAGRGMFNSRFAQFTRHGSHLEEHLYPIDQFPFTTTYQVDPLSGSSGSMFESAILSNSLPKMMIINSSTDYWTRGASLLHTNVEGSEDVSVHDAIRIYSIAGLPHTSPRIGVVSRALLLALDSWVTDGELPPPSRYPTIESGTLVDFKSWSANWPDISEVRKPESYYKPVRLNFGPRWQEKGIADIVPATPGSPYITLVPQVDLDGNEIAGIQFPEILVPLKTYSGWKMRGAHYSNSLSRNSGQSVTFPESRLERWLARDPRKSIEERYKNRADYLDKFTRATLRMHAQGFLLDSDVNLLIQQAVQDPYWKGHVQPSRVDVLSFVGEMQNSSEGRSISIKVLTTPQGSEVPVAYCKVRGANYLRVNLVFDEMEDVWTGVISVPADVSSGEYQLDLVAYDASFLPLLSKDGDWETINVMIP